jgi:AraC-like DNA-binding protein
MLLTSDVSRGLDLDRGALMRLSVAQTLVRCINTRDAGPTNVPGLTILQYPYGMPLGSCHDGLCVCFRASTASASERTCTDGDDSSVLAVVNLPKLTQVRAASPDTPDYCIIIDVDLDTAREIIAEIAASGHIVCHCEAGGAIGLLKWDLLDAVARLVSLIERPRDIPFLSSFAHREIIYHILMSDVGDRLRQKARTSLQANRIAKAIDWLRENFTRRLRIEELADIANMGISTFHRHFQEVMAMSPLQYQKCLRLNEAKRLMLVDQVDATSAALLVGYESVTQFNREYRRLFGEPPMRYVKALRNGRAP